jgi:hypothetical protein
MDTTVLHAFNALGPWLVVAGMGALHGLNPASGWAMAAAWGLHNRHRAQAWRALLPIALGHGASVALVAVAVVYGWSFNRAALQVMVAVVLVAVAGAHVWRRKASVRQTHTGHVGLALGSFLLSGAHGAGLMLVPALVPLCLGPGSTGSTAGPIAMALAAVGIHMAAMWLVTGLTASIAVAATQFLLRRGAWSLPCPSFLSKFALHVRRECEAPPSITSTPSAKAAP